MSLMPKEECKYWNITASLDDGIFIQSHHKIPHHSIPICLPPQLDHTLHVGWQHGNYGVYVDPKQTIAEHLISELEQSDTPLLEQLIDEQEDNVLRDLVENIEDDETKW
jgi:hypothetical protein